MRSPKAHAPQALVCAAALAALLALPAGAIAANATSTPAGGTAAPPASTPASTVAPTTTPPAATTTLTPSAAGTPGTAPATRAPGTAPATRAPGTARAGAAKTGGGGVSGWAILAAVLGALLALAALVWAVFRFGAYEPHWLQSARHSFGEAGYRASATWAEFADWARIGH